MKLDNNNAAVVADSIDGQTGTGSGEIDLYEELTAFAELSPEEQLRLLDQAGKTADQIEIPAAPEQGFSFDSVPSHPSTEPAQAEILAGTAKPSTEELPSAALTLPEALIEPVDAEIAPSRTDMHTAQELPAVGPPPVEGTRPSGPLSGFSLTPDFVFTGALSKGVCLACGAESGTDDLFCLSCGVFIDEVGSTLPLNPTICAECKRGISADEIFCPWCGSVLPA